MKKILLLIPILGICSSLLAQAPQVLNVNANQVDGTKDVLIEFEITNKIDYSGDLNVEVWYRTSPDQTQWERAMSLWESADFVLPANEELIAGADGEEWVRYSHRIPRGGDVAEARSIYWKAGDDAHDVKTDQAQVRVIVFYTKEGPEGAAATPKDQVSGWDGFDDGSTGGDTGGGGDGGVNDGIPVYQLTIEEVGYLSNNSINAAGYFTIDGYTVDDPNLADYGVFYGKIAPANENPPSSGTWEKDPVSEVDLNPEFSTMADVDNYLAQQALTPIGHITSEESSF